MSELIIKCSRMILVISQRDLVQALIKADKFEQALEKGKAYTIRGEIVRAIDKKKEDKGL